MFCNTLITTVHYFLLKFILENGCGNVISPMHDIPLFAKDDKSVYNMVVEVPRWTNAKMEVSRLNNLYISITKDCVSALLSG